MRTKLQETPSICFSSLVLLHIVCTQIVLKKEYRLHVHNDTYEMAGSILTEGSYLLFQIP